MQVIGKYGDTWWCGVEEIEVHKNELRTVICRTLEINEMYDNEEIFEMLRELWSVSECKNGML